MTGLISSEERSAAEYCMEAILRHGARQARVSLSKSAVDSICTRDGELDKVTHSSDRAIFMSIFADGKFGSFSTNVLDKEALDNFTAKAVSTVRLLEEDPFRKLPDPALTAKDAVSGREAGLFDESWAEMDGEKRLALAYGESIFREEAASTGKYRILSEESEYSDSVEDSLTIDSQGFAGRHTETSFAVCSELTIADRRGRKFSGYMWDSAPFLTGLRCGTCSKEALQKAVNQLNPRKHKGGRMMAVIDKSVSSRLIAPVFTALQAMAIQQKSSFLRESLGMKVFPESLTVMDFARSFGRPGARLFDSEGLATKESPIIEAGVVKTWYVTTYMSGKMGVQPTVDAPSRPTVLPVGWDSASSGAGLVGASSSAGLDGADGAGSGAADGSVGLWDAAALMRLCGEGIYITGFNGGNCNPVTGDFSYGIEGFAFKDGVIQHPVREMLITGNMIKLWNSLIAAGNDPRRCTRWQIPSLAFENVDFSG